MPMQVRARKALFVMVVLAVTGELAYRLVPTEARGSIRAPFPFL